MTYAEVNFDGIVDPTHNYSGLSYGNIASVKHRSATSNPKQAALQGLAKMKYLLDLGIPQGFIPPQERPNMGVLRSLGFSGSDSAILQKALKEFPELLFACSSASSMWTANAATISPSIDSADGRLHITAANLTNKFHRSIEAAATAKTLQAIFPNIEPFMHHPPLPAGTTFADEGAANHTRFCSEMGKPGIQLFVFGRYGFSRSGHIQQTSIYPARQTFEASQAIVRLHQLDIDRVVLAQQNPEAIDAGVFHNDVISVGHQNFYFYHEKTFADTEFVDRLRRKFEKVCQDDLITCKVMEKDVPLKDAVDAYLFNSQIVTLPNNTLCMIAPIECQEISSVKRFLEAFQSRTDHPIRKIVYSNLRESMRNGGGPACLRLRVVMNEREKAAANQGYFLTPERYEQLVDWVNGHYRDRLSPEDLADPELLHESRAALESLKRILG